MTITYVKKILRDGQLCEKCAEVSRRLSDSGYLQYIDAILEADERDPQSPGMLLAAELGVERAPFFVVEQNGQRSVYTVYLKFVREVLNQRVDEVKESAEILRNNPDLDFI